jgi:magnesium-transporting ATPase (P-type)
LFFLGAVGARGSGLAESATLYRQATTACLTAIVVTQVVNVFLCRSERASALSATRNRFLVVGIAVELLLIGAIDYTRWGNIAFSTAPLPLSVWLFTLPFAGLMLVVDECRKAWGRQRRSSASSIASTTRRRA